MSRPAVLEQDPGAWMADAIDYIVRRANAVGTVTADDLRRDLPEPHHPNAVGRAFGIASSRNLITKVRPVNSTTRSRHGGGSWAWGLHESQMVRAA